jgi:hypothetical protein
MMTMRFGIAALGLVVLAVGGAACNLIDFDRRNLQDQPPPVDQPPVDRPPPDASTDPPPGGCTPVIAEATPEYEAMCRHYCNELQATIAYASHNQPGGGVSADSCYEQRCVRRCVSRELCETQCRSLGNAYQTLCGGVDAAPETMCPVSIDERVATCMAGCAVWPPPPEPPPLGLK